MSAARERTFETQGRPTTSATALQVKVNGSMVIVDVQTFTGKERQLMRGALAKLDYEADELDGIFAALWIVLRRTEPLLSYDDVLEQVTLGDVSSATKVDPAEDDSPEA